MKKFLGLMLLLSVALWGQVAPIPAPIPVAVPVAKTAIFQPTYFVGAGSSYDYYGKGGLIPNTSFGIRIASTGIYSYTTIDLGRTTATFRTGAAFIFYQVGNWSLMGLGDAGLASTSGSSTLGSYSGGGFVLYDIGNRSNSGNHFYIGLGGRLVQTSTQGKEPVLAITFGKGF